MASYAGASHATVTEKLCPSRHFRRTRQPSHPPLRFVGNSRFPSFYPLPLPAFVLPIFLLAAEELCRPFHEEQGWLGESVREFGGEPSSAAMEASLSGPETSARVGGGWPSQMVGTRGDEFRTCICLPRQVLSCRLYST